MAKGTCFNVTMLNVLEDQFRQWLWSRDMTMVEMGTDDAGTPCYVAVIAPGTDTERRLMEGRWESG